MRPRRGAGFTLIEILIVMLIISIVAASAVLTLRSNESKQIESFTQELVQKFSLAQERAMLQPAVLGFSIEHQELVFKSLAYDAKKKQPVWVPLVGESLSKQRIPDNIQVNIHTRKPKEAQQSEQTKSNPNPDVVIATNGDLSPFSLYVGKRGYKPRFLITGDVNGQITSQDLH